MCCLNVSLNYYSVDAPTLYPKMSFFLPRGKKLVWRIFFLYFLSHTFYHQSFAPIGVKSKRCVWLLGQKNLIINSCDFLTPTDAAT
jgi:hypothetical protein